MLKGFWCLTLGLLFLLPGLAVGQESFDETAAAAASARDQGNVPQAISLYQKAVGLNSKWPDGWWYLGSLEYGSNEFEPASDALSHYLELTPSAGPAFALRGLCEFELTKYPESLQDLQRAIALGAANQPRNAGIILYHEALLLTRAGRFEEALGQYTIMVKHNSLNQDVINGIGMAGLRLVILPADIVASQAEMISTVGTAASAVMSGDLPGAQKAFRAVFERYPTSANLHYLYGYLLFGAAPDDAIAQFQQELTVTPASAITHAMLAWAYGIRGEFAAGLPHAQKAAEEDPSLPLAQLVLGRAMIETGDVKGGMPHLEAVLASEPQNLEAHLGLAKAYSELGRKEDARRERLACLALSGQGAAPDASM
jgi:tetratricopeptide (TPR) repeat protein